MKRTATIAACMVMLAGSLAHGQMLFAQRFASTSSPLGTYIPVTSGLVGAWLIPGYTTSAIAQDMSGNGHALSATNSPQWATNGFAGTMYFSGANCAMRGVDTGMPTGAQARTFCAWVRMSSETGYPTILGYGTGATGKAMGMQTYNGQMSLFAYATNPSGAGTATMVTQTWYHVCIVYTGGGITYYQNGSANGTATISGINTTLGGGVSLGTMFPSYDAPNFYPLTGYEDSVLVYNRALSAAEIASTYAAQHNKGGTSH